MHKPAVVLEKIKIKKYNRDGIEYRYLLVVTVCSAVHIPDRSEGVLYY